ncbi:hypothetical protein [Methanolobus sp. ZRKC5]|uniref:hypothetical protein n=1 Tax=unclassified Methanolobus TaxID=2629569 RepID=UPI00313DD991
MEKPSEELTILLADVLADFDVEFRKMFRTTVHFVKGNMFAGVHGDGIMLRLKSVDQELLFAEHNEAAPFEPMGRLSH